MLRKKMLGKSSKPIEILKNKENLSKVVLFTF